MKKPSTLFYSLLLCVALTLFGKSANAQVVDSTTILFNVDTIAKNLGYPWEITEGPDDSLWVTEARGYRVLRISKTRTGAQKNVPAQQVLKIPVPFSRNGTFRFPQGGMQGLAIHPEFMTNVNKRWVYLSIVNGGNTGCLSSDGSTPCIMRSEVVRCRFYFAADAGNPTSGLPKRDTLVITDTLIDNLPGSNDHNSGRLTIKPVMEGGTYKLYYTIGDMGAGQFNNQSRPNNAQDIDTCEGKVLRLNTEPDGDSPLPGITHQYNTFRDWIPNDNPYFYNGGAGPFGGLKTPIYTWGHRNPQGLVWANVQGTWHLYSSEHGDKSDDEVNDLVMGNNYGWPKVAGMGSDNNYSSTDAFANNDRLANQLINYTEVSWATTNVMHRPLFVLFNQIASQIKADGSDIYNWGTVAASSIDYYNGNIPGWKNSLLVTSLKYGMFRLKLKADGSFVDSTASANTVDTFPLLHGWRIRDVAINKIANSGMFWAITDSTGDTSGPTGGFGNGVGTPAKDGGKILKFTFKTIITLPVKFGDFVGALLTDKTIRLNWEAEIEDKHRYFEIEKSTNGSSFSPIGRVDKGGVNQFIDVNPNVGSNYYRIKEVDADGKAVYSKVINIKYDPTGYIVSLYPNPISYEMNIKISSPRSNKIQVQVTDLSGRIIYSQGKSISSGINQINVDTRTWSAQTYSVKITDRDNNILTQENIIKL